VTRFHLEQKDIAMGSRRGATLSYIVSAASLLSSTSSCLRSRSFLITGATDGIGRHTSQLLASDGHSLLIHGRKSSSDQNVVSLLRDLESRGAKHVSYVQADLGDLEQVFSLAEDVLAELRSWQSLSSPAVPALDCLINNAGVFDPTPRHSKQGYDMTMAVNVLAPFVLTRRLLPCLIRGEDVRIITTSSISQSRTMPDLNSLFARKDDSGNYDYTPLPYSGHAFYSHSKLGDLLFSMKLANVLSSYQPSEDLKRQMANNASTLENIQRIQCLTMDPGTVNTKMLLAGWGPCGISVKDANNTYKLATSEEYAFGSRMKSGSYHFGGGPSHDAKDEIKLHALFSKLSDCTGVSYDDLSRDCF